MSHCHRTPVAVRHRAGEHGAGVSRRSSARRSPDASRTRRLAMPGVTVTVTNTQTNEVITAITNDARACIRCPFLRPGIYKVAARAAGLPPVRAGLGAARSRPVADDQHRAAGRRPDRSRHRRREAIEVDEGRSRHRHRQPAHHRAAAERAQSVHAVVSLAGHHLQRAGDLSAAVRQRRHRRLVDQRRPEPQQRVPARRRAEQLDPGRQQHRLRAAGRRRAGVQDRHQQLRRAVRPHRRRRHQRLAQVGHERVPRHGLRVRAAQGVRLERVPLQASNNREKPDHKLDQYGFQVDGPVRIPGLYDGRDKTFFMFNYEGYQEATPNPATYTVPDEAQLRGDFSNLRDAQGRLITIYDPAHRPPRERPAGCAIRSRATSSRRIASTRWRSGSLQYFLRPNTTPAAGPIRGATTSSSRRTSRSTLPQHRDQGRSERQRQDADVLPLRLQQADRGALHQRHHERARRRTASCRSSGINHTGVADWVRTIGLLARLQHPRRPESVPRAGAIRSGPRLQPGRARLPVVAGQPAAEPGVPAHQRHRLPGRSGAPAATARRRPCFSLQPNFSWTKGTHNLRGGLDMRLTWYTREINGNLFVMSFDRRFTQRVFNSGDALERQLDRVVPARRRQRRRRSTTTSIRRSAGTTTRRGCRTTGS